MCRLSIWCGQWWPSRLLGRVNCVPQGARCHLHTQALGCAHNSSQAQWLALDTWVLGVEAPARRPLVTNTCGQCWQHEPGRQGRAGIPPGLSVESRQRGERPGHTRVCWEQEEWVSDPRQI